MALGLERAMQLSKGCSWRLLALGMFHLLGAVCAQSCEPLSDKALSNCRFGGCCDDVGGANKSFGSFYASLRNRTGRPGNLKRQLATFYPAGGKDGQSDLSELPSNAEKIIDGAPVSLSVHLHVFKVSSINQKAQTFAMQYKVKWIWKDCRAVFNCSAPIIFTGADKLAGNFWTPQWSIAEEEDDNVAKRATDFKIVGNGVTIFTERRVGVFRCKFDFRNMPNDIQKCRLSLTLPGFKDSQISLHWLDISSDDVSNAEWIVEQGASWSKTSSVETEPPTSYSGPFSYPKLTAEFTLTRDPGYLQGNFFDQVNLFYVLSYMGLWISANAVPARVAAGVIPALTTSNKMSALAAILPPIAYPTRLSRFLQLNLFIIVVHFVLYGMTHFASMRLKSIKDREAEIEKKKNDNPWAWTANEDEVPEEGREPLCRNFEKSAVTMIDAYLEPAARILSPLIYIIAVLVIYNT
eukprot:TRINITY_DN78929_c0_g1_i1.p1 TRINITY_DN78929_c0_g1~~TRINITY_DN78929_c0_g1_i1.p1  ORF type:complete len:465 (-),score=59.64 TRINITY_DN78929_c0_g1_i1:205-1599(-)